MVIHSGAPERTGGKEEEEDEGWLACRAMYIWACHLLRAWQGCCITAQGITWGTRSRLARKGRDGVLHNDDCASPWGGFCVVRANPRPEGLWEPVPGCCELWMTRLLLGDMNSKPGLLGAPSLSITRVAWTLNVFRSYRCCAFPWVGQHEKASDYCNWEVLNSVQVFSHLISE